MNIDVPPRLKEHPYVAAFLKAIAEDPKDLAPPLIFADWLEEYGESELANALRLECLERTKKPEPPKPPKPKPYVAPHYSSGWRLQLTFNGLFDLATCVLCVLFIYFVLVPILRFGIALNLNLIAKWFH